MMESRPLDARYDSTYIGPFTNVQMDNRVRAAMSSSDAVSGQPRYKYFRRPVMPRMSAIPPSVLLAPTVAETDPNVPMEDIPEPAQKTQEVQTVFRDSEAQTTPYTPDYTVAEGEDPEVLMLKDLSFGNGLPLSQKDLEMIHYAKSKKELESHLPPFTDEASMNLRKKLMEQQEMREFSLREKEIDRRREERLAELSAALMEKNESNELLSAQRVESIRQVRIEEREIALTKIRNKRIKVLRRLARKRNTQDPIISENRGHDPVQLIFDKASHLYAPIKRDGAAPKKDSTAFDVGLRTAPLDNMNKIRELEDAIPPVLKDADFKSTNMNVDKTRMMSQTDGGIGTKKPIRAAEHRLTSAAQRSLRNTKRDVEEMHRILIQKKRTQQLASAQAAGNRAASRGSKGVSTPGIVGDGRPASTPQVTRKTPNGRPNTPDLTLNEEGQPFTMNHNLKAAITLIQSLIRGRAVQTVMHDGRIRRSELIHELRSADESLAAQALETAVDVANEEKMERERRARQNTVDAVVGGASSGLMVLLNQEQVCLFMTLLSLSIPSSFISFSY